MDASDNATNAGLVRAVLVRSTLLCSASSRLHAPPFALRDRLPPMRFKSFLSASIGIPVTPSPNVLPDRLAGCTQGLDASKKPSWAQRTKSPPS